MHAGGVTTDSGGRSTSSPRAWYRIGLSTTKRINRDIKRSEYEYNVSDLYIFLVHEGHKSCPHTVKYSNSHPEIHRCDNIDNRDNIKLSNIKHFFTKHKEKRKKEKKYKNKCTRRIQSFPCNILSRQILKASNCNSACMATLHINHSLSATAQV